MIDNIHVFDPEHYCPVCCFNEKAFIDHKESMSGRAIWNDYAPVIIDRITSLDIYCQNCGVLISFEDRVSPIYKAKDLPPNWRNAWEQRLNKAIAEWEGMRFRKQWRT